MPIRVVYFDGLFKSSEFLQGVIKVNKIQVHKECIDARYACLDCSKIIANVLGISVSIFLMLRAYVLRTEQGDKYVHPVN